MPDNGYVYYDERPRLGQHLGRFVALLGVVFAVVVAIVVVQRLSDDTLALTIGLLLAGVPLLAIIGLLIWVLARRGQPQPPPQQMTIPPIIMQIPQQPQQPALPNYSLPWEGTMQRTGDGSGRSLRRSSEMVWLMIQAIQFGRDQSRARCGNIGLFVDL